MANYAAANAAAVLERGASVYPERLKRSIAAMQQK